MSTKKKALPRLRRLPRDLRRAALILGSEGKNESFQPQNEFKLDPWITIDIGGIDFSINKAVLLPGAGQRASRSAR